MPFLVQAGAECFTEPLLKLWALLMLRMSWLGLSRRKSTCSITVSSMLATCLSSASLIRPCKLSPCAQPKAYSSLCRTPYAL